MKYLIVSDIHENFHNLSIVFQYCADKNITHGLVLGDLINPGIMHNLGKSGMHLTIILGNNDGDVFNLYKVAQTYTCLSLFNEFASLEIENKKLFLIHNNHLGELIAKSQEFDYVLCGHNHITTKEVFGKTTLINPGELSGHMYGKSTFMEWDSEYQIINLITIKNDWVDVKRYKHDTEYMPKDVQFEIKAL